MCFLCLLKKNSVTNSGCPTRKFKYKEFMSVPLFYYQVGGDGTHTDNVIGSTYIVLLSLNKHKEQLKETATRVGFNPLDLLFPTERVSNTSYQSKIMHVKDQLQLSEIVLVVIWKEF